jgi:hypothetical protein
MWSVAIIVWRQSNAFNSPSQSWTMSGPTSCGVVGVYNPGKPGEAHGEIHRVYLGYKAPEHDPTPLPRFDGHPPQIRARMQRKSVLFPSPPCTLIQCSPAPGSPPLPPVFLRRVCVYLARRSGVCQSTIPHSYVTAGLHEGARTHRN